MNVSPGKVYLIAGLGNPGPDYSASRHNMGFRVISLWARKMGVRFRGRRFKSRNALVALQGREVVLLRPATFMNRSGEAVKACADFYGLDLENILVVHDDLDIPLGRIKVVRDGGAGGHKGVISIMDQLGSRDFYRVKIGIGRPRFGEPIEEFVLAPFYVDEEEIAEKIVEVGTWACELFVLDGVEAAMSKVNCLNLRDKEVIN